MPFEQWSSRPIKLWLTILSSLTLLHMCTCPNCRFWKHRVVSTGWFLEIFPKSVWGG